MSSSRRPASRFSREELETIDLAGRALVGGATAGAFAGLAMVVYTAGVLVLFTNHWPLLPLYVAGAPVLGTGTFEWALTSGFHFGVVDAAVGLTMYLAVSAWIGVVFGFACLRWQINRGGALRAGILVALAAMLLLNAILLPLLDLPTLASFHAWPLVAFEHVIFGFVLGLWPLARPHDVGRSRPQRSRPGRLDRAGVA